MWIDLQHHRSRSLPALADSAPLPELRAAIRPIVVDWIGRNMPANATPRGFRLRLIAQIAAARPPGIFDYLAVTAFPPSIGVLALGVVVGELNSWIERSRRFSFEPSEGTRVAHP